MGNYSIISGRLFFTISEKHAIIREYLESGRSKEEIWRKYTGKSHHGRLTIWMRDLGYMTSQQQLKPNIASKLSEMSTDRKQNSSVTPMEIDNAQLKKRVAELERQLKEAQMKAIAFETMVEIAERETKIPIRKKYSAKP